MGRKGSGKKSPLLENPRNYLIVRHHEVLGLKDEDDASNEANGRHRSEDAAPVFQEKVTKNHHLEKRASFFLGRTATVEVSTAQLQLYATDVIQRRITIELVESTSFCN